MYVIGIALCSLGGIGSLVCLIMVLIKMFQNEQPLIAVLGILCTLWAFIWGWMKSGTLGLKNIMLLWTACIVVLIIGEVITFADIAAKVKSGEIKVQTTP
jgi:hypothetical protein